MQTLKPVPDAFWIITGTFADFYVLAQKSFKFIIKSWCKICGNM
jgi:hypothetical protein